MDGGSVAGTIFVVFLVLKLTHTITWSWWWVTAPLWIDVLASLVLLVLIAVGVLGSFGIFKAVSRSRPAAHRSRW